MKTILKDGQFQRVSNEIADTEVSFKRATYAPKSEWKQNVRNNKSIETKIAEVKGDATKSKKADKAAKLKNKQRPTDAVDNFLR